MPPNLGRFTGAFPSLKSGLAIPYEGTILRDLFYFLEYDLTVQNYRVRPFSIPGVSAKGKPCNFIPDCLVQRATSQELVTCVPETVAQGSTKQEEFTYLHTWANEHGYDFRVITDTALRSGHRLANLKLLWRFCRVPLPSGLITRCITFLSIAPHSAAFLDLAAHLSEANHPLTQSKYLYRLLFQQVLDADLDQPLTPSSHVWLSRTVQ